MRNLSLMQSTVTPVVPLLGTPDVAITVRPQTFNAVEELAYRRLPLDVFERAARGDLDDDRIRSFIAAAE